MNNLVMKVSYSANDGGGGNDGTTHGRTVRKLTSDSKANIPLLAFLLFLLFFEKKTQTYYRILITGLFIWVHKN